MHRSLMTVGASPVSLQLRCSCGGLSIHSAANLIECACE